MIRPWLILLTLTGCGILGSGAPLLNDRRPNGRVCVNGSFDGTGDINGIAYVISNTEAGQWFLYLENLNLPESNLFFELDVSNPSAVLARRQVIGTTGNKTFTIPTPEPGQQFVQVRTLRASTIAGQSISTASFGIDQCQTNP